MSDRRDETVLVVDDQEPLVDAYAQWLDDRYAVRTATSGAGALDRVDDDVDVILLDRRMPGIDGEEVVRELDRRGLDCGVILVSANRRDDRLHGLDYELYLEKPVSDPNRLFEAVESVVDRRMEPV